MTSPPMAKDLTVQDISGDFEAGARRIVRDREQLQLEHGLDDARGGDRCFHKVRQRFVDVRAFGQDVVRKICEQVFGPAGSIAVHDFADRDRTLASFPQLPYKI